MPQKPFDANMSDAERWAAMVGGSALLLSGLKKRSAFGVVIAGSGALMLRWGATGHCPFYQTFGINTGARGRNEAVPYELGKRVDEVIKIRRPAEQLYDFWRDLKNISMVMQNVESVTPLDGRCSKWVVKGPAGTTVEWEAEVINDIPNKLIGWRTIRGSQVDVAGSVRFRQTAGGTEIRVSLQYNPPAGMVGDKISKMMGVSPRQQIRDDLQRFKMLVESGQITLESRQRSDFPGEFATAGKGSKVQQASEESFPASDPPSWTPATV